MFSVLSLNLHGQRDRWLGRRELLLAGILRDLPDFIAFQDVHIARRQVNWLVRQLNARWGAKLYHRAQMGSAGLFGSFSGGGVAILSRLPILWKERVELGVGGVGVLANIELPLGRTLDFASVRFTPGRHIPGVRYEQAMALLQALIAPGRSDYQLIAGDFNAAPESRAIHRIKQNYQSGFERVYGCEPVSTFPTALVELDPHWSGCLDYLFVSNSVEVSTVRFFGRKSHPEDPKLFMSSHIGLLAQIDFPSIRVG